MPPAAAGTERARACGEREGQKREVRLPAYPPPSCPPPFLFFFFATEKGGKNRRETGTKEDVFCKIRATHFRFYFRKRGENFDKSMIKKPVVVFVREQRELILDVQ